MKRAHAQSGFTLLELVLVLGIVGLMAAFGMEAASGLQAVECNGKTAEQLARVQSAVQGFVATNGRLPRPALVTRGSSDGEFGREVTALPHAELVDTGTVLIGSLPHVTLGLPLEFAADCWGNKFTYAVTKSLTTNDPVSGYGPSSGAITLRTGTRAAAQDLSTNSGYLVISHGANKLGATPLTAGNVTARWCTLVGGSEIDRENCDATNAIFFDGLANSGTVADNAYDDIIVFESKTPVAPPTPASSTYAWGLNDVGQLGDGTTTNRTTPVMVSTALSFTQVSGGTSTGDNHTCGVTSTGAAYCWGGNTDGKLGDGTTTNRSTPVAVVGGLSFAQISAGRSNTCGITTTGAAYCWGDRLALGQATLGSDSATPVAVTGGLTFAQISVGGSSHACGVTTTGAGYCWGSNVYGEIGDGTNTTRSPPTLVSGGLSFKQIETSFSQSCGITTSNDAYCWGHNEDGQLGDGTIIDRLTPTPVAGGLKFIQISTGSLHTCGITTDFAAYCWGSGTSGALANGSYSDQTTPYPVSGGHVFMQIAAGGEQSCAITPTGTAYCAGRSMFGSNGNGSTMVVNSPTAVSGGHSFAQIAAGFRHTIAVQGTPPCMVDGTSNGGHASVCCNGDSDGNGTCGTQACTADGLSSGGNPANCCNGDSDGNGTCGTQMACHPSFGVYFAYAADCTGAGDDVLVNCPPGEGADANYYGSNISPAQCGSIPDPSTWAAAQCRPC